MKATWHHHELKKNLKLQKDLYNSKTELKAFETSDSKLAEEIDPQESMNTVVKQECLRFRLCLSKWRIYKLTACLLFRHGASVKMQLNIWSPLKPQGYNKLLTTMESSLKDRADLTKGTRRILDKIHQNPHAALHCRCFLQGLMCLSGVPKGHQRPDCNQLSYQHALRSE